MEPQIQKQLEEKDQTSFHKQMLQDCITLVDMSRKKMSSYYAQWDKNDEVYQGKRQPDTADQKAQQRGEPVKMIVPITYAQTQTFAAFCFSLFMQRENVFELMGKNENSHRPAKISESLLQRDLQFNLFEAKLYQILIDIARFSLGVVKITWCKETQVVREYTKTKPIDLGFFSLGGGREVVTEKTVTKYQGNKLMSVSPYRFYPDTRLPITRFQEGEFCASEDEYSMTQLYQLQADGYVAGIDHIDPMRKDRVSTRGGHRMSEGFTTPDVANTTVGSGQTQSTVIVTEVVRQIIPEKYMIDGKPLGKGTRPEKWLIWYANDQRIIRCEKYGYMHDEYPYAVGTFSPDIHNLVGLALADTIDSLQDVMTWFINSRITSVRKVIQNFLVVDPAGVEMDDLKQRRPVIRLKPNMALQGGIDRWIKQLEVNDVTTNHLKDADYLQGLIQLTTGINDNMLGQFHTGRRSATEARNVGTSAAARLKMTATLIFRMCLETMARQMVSNLKDGLDEETLVRVVGLNEASQTPYLPVTRTDLAGEYDFEVFDGTLPSERSQAADIFAQLLEAFVKSPDSAIAIGLDPKKIYVELMELRNIKNPERFLLQQAPQLPQQPNVVPLPGQGAPAPTPAQPQGANGLAALAGL